MYDQKYHPMDDIIRPSQAAKRRSLHGERPVLGSGSDSGDLEESGSDVGSIACDEDSDDKESQQPTQGRKRRRARSLTPESIRRSSRRKTKPKVSYNMKIHPQDSDLKRVWACDGSKSSPLPTKHVSPTEAISLTKKTPSDDFEEACRPLLVEDLEGKRSVQAVLPAAVDNTYHLNRLLVRTSTRAFPRALGPSEACPKTCHEAGR